MKPDRSTMQSEESFALDLFQAIALIKNSAEAKAFFTDLCTPNEIQALTDRWRVVNLIKSGKSYRSICTLTQISVTTIGRVARALTYGCNGYNLLYTRWQKFKKKINNVKGK